MSRIIDRVNEEPHRRRELLALGVVEAFRAKAEGRAPAFESLPEDASPVAPGHAFTRNERFAGRTYEVQVTIDEVSYDRRGLVKVMCHGTVGDARINYDLPIYIVDPPLRVEDEEEEEDPVAALEYVLVDLAQEANPNGDR